MTLFDLAQKNVKGNFKSYLIYFVSMLFSVVIYYTFVTLRYSEEINESVQSSASMASIFTIASIMLILFVAIFIGYSNSFFAKKRKKEIGLYSLLGVRKKAIGSMLFYENLIMGALVLVAGIVLGTFLSKLFVMIMLRLLELPAVASMSVSLAAIANTVVVFSIIIVATSFQSYRLIYRFSLIELFRAEQEGEQSPKASLVAAVAAVLLLAFGYWVAFQRLDSNLQLLRNYLLILGAIIAGTFLLFRSVTVYMLRATRAYKPFYYKGMNLFGTSQLLYRVRSNFRMLATIALLSSFTLCALSVGYSMYYTNQRTAVQTAPFSYMHISDGGAFDRTVERTLEADKAHPVAARLDIPVVKVKGTSSNDDLIPARYSNTDENPVKVMSETDYNKAVHTINAAAENVRLSGEQALLIRPMYTSWTAADVLGQTVTLNLSSGNRQLPFVGLSENRVLNWSFPDVVIVVDDGLYAGIAGQGQLVTYKAYRVTDPKTTKETAATLTAESPKEAQLSAYYTVYRGGLEEGALNMFVLGFLGLVFLAATGSIIYFKQLTDAHTDQGRYAILRKIGVSRKQVRASIAKQTMFVFGLPLAVGILHSAVVLQSLSRLFSVLAGVNLAVPILISMGAYILIYIGYYVLTVQSFDRIVNR